MSEIQTFISICAGTVLFLWLADMARQALADRRERRQITRWLQRRQQPQDNHHNK